MIKQQPSLITKKMVDDYQRDGAVLIKGLLTDWVDTICSGIEKNMQSPGEYAAENTTDNDSGRFFDDYCNWQRITEFQNVIQQSTLAQAAAELMQSNEAQLFHDHVLVKEPGTSKATPWHQDSPYYFVEGHQTVSFWCPVDVVEDATLRCVAASHLWEKPVLPTRWLSETAFYPDENLYLPVLQNLTWCPW